MVFPGDVCFWCFSMAFPEFLVDASLERGQTLNDCRPVNIPLRPLKKTRPQDGFPISQKVPQSRCGGIKVFNKSFAI